MSKLDDILEIKDEKNFIAKARKQYIKQAIKALMLDIVGEDFKHSNGKVMKHPSYECEECGEPAPEWIINVVKRELRQKIEEL